MNIDTKNPMGAYLASLKAHEEAERFRKLYARNEDAEILTKLEREKMNKAIELCGQIDAEIKKAEGRATARTISGIGILRLLHEIDGRFEIVPKTVREGMAIHADIFAQDFPNAYRYTPESTHFTAIYKRGSWRITSIYRDRCGRPKQRISVSMPKEMEARILESYRHF